MSTEAGRKAVRKHSINLVVGLLLLVSGASTSRAEVKIVQMKIAGYLCGN